jgi:hypothetical protein
MSEIPRGAIRFNTDSNKPELWDGSQWAEFQLSTPNLGRSVDTQPGARGLFAGGYQPGAYQNDIDYINIASTGNTQDFGTLNNAVTAGGGVGSRTRALFAGGYIASGGSPTPNSLAQIDTVVFASTGNASDFGDMALNHFRRGSAGNATRGLFAGGGNPNTTDPQIDYVTIATTGTANDYGDLTQTRSRMGGAGSPTRSMFAGGFTGPSPGNFWRDTIDFVTTPTLGNAQDFGNLTQGKGWTAACSNATRMLIGGGVISPGNTAVSEMEYITISTTGNAVMFGDLNIVVDTGHYAGSAVASSTRGVFNAGLFLNPSATYVNTIYYVEISTQGKAVDFGDLDGKRYGVQTCSNGHGGL